MNNLATQIELVIEADVEDLGSLSALADLDPASDFVGLQLVSVDLSHQDLTGFDFSLCDLTGASFNETNLSGAKLEFATLVEANLVEADLTRAALKGANLTNADLSGSYIGESILDAGNISGAIISGAWVNDKSSRKKIKEKLKNVASLCINCGFFNTKYNDECDKCGHKISDNLIHQKKSRTPADHVFAISDSRSNTIRPSKKLILALEAVIDIAFHSGPEPVQSHDIARRLILPRRYLEQIMQQLVRAGILRGVRGPRGGYRLARERNHISVGHVVRVVRGIEELPAQEEFGSASELGRRVVGPFWTNTEHELMTRLDRITVDDLCRRAEERGVRSEAIKNLFNLNTVY